MIVNPKQNILVSRVTWILLLFQLHFPLSVSWEQLNASFVQYDSQTPTIIVQPKLKFLGVSSCAIVGGWYPCSQDRIGAMEVRISNGTGEGEFRFFGKSGAIIPVDEWLLVDNCGWYSMAVSDSFLPQPTEPNVEWKVEGGGRYRFRELRIRPGCNGIEGFALEFQLNRNQYSLDDPETPTKPVPTLGFIAYNSNLTLTPDDLLEQMALDRKRSSVSVLEPGYAANETAPNRSQLTFSTAQFHSTSTKCLNNDDTIEVSELYIWLGKEGYTVKLQAPTKLSFEVGRFYHTFGRNNRRRNATEWARVTLEGPSGRGPLNTDLWCSEFEGRVLFRVLHVHECYRFCFRANIAIELEQWCIDEPTPDQLANGVDVQQRTWASIRINSTLPPNLKLVELFIGNGEIFEDPIVDYSSNANSSPEEEKNLGEPSNIEGSFGDENDDEDNLEVRHLLDTARSSFQAEFLSLRYSNQTIRSTFDGIERLGFVSKRMCARYGGGYEILPCTNDNQISGLEFSLVVKDNSTSRPKRYRIQLYAPHGEWLQPNRWYERVTGISFDACANAHSNVDVALYNIGYNGEDNFPYEPEGEPFINFGRFQFRELELRSGCSGVNRFALDVQLHRNIRTSLPIFLFVRYQSSMMINQTDILQRRQEYDLDRFSASFESVAPDVSWVNHSQTITRPAENFSTESLRLSFNASMTNLIWEISFEYVETSSIIGGCSKDGIQGFGIVLQPEYNRGWEENLGIGAPSKTPLLKPRKWYAASDDYSRPPGFGYLSVYGYQCDRRIGAFYVHELSLRDCCALFGNFAMDFVMYCVEPTEKQAVYGWVRFNSSVPIDKGFATQWSIQGIVDLAAADQSSPPMASTSSPPTFLPVAKPTELKNEGKEQPTSAITVMPTFHHGSASIDETSASSLEPKASNSSDAGKTATIASILCVLSFYALCALL